MKTIITIIIICIFITGCGEKEDKPVKININRDGTFLVDGGSMNNSQLKTYIEEKMAEQDQESKIIFLADEDTLFTNLEPAILDTAEATAYWFFFQIKESAEIEECFSNYYPHVGPPNKKIDLEIKDNLLYINNRELSDAELTAYLKGEPDYRITYFFLISCSGNTTFGTFYRFIKRCNNFKDMVFFELQTMDKIIKNSNRSSADSVTAAPEK